MRRSRVAAEVAAEEARAARIASEVEANRIATENALRRSRIEAEIEADKLKVNWQPAKGPSQDVSEGDVISLRGKGRMELAEITGTSRKGRIGVLLKRYM